MNKGESQITRQELALLPTPEFTESWHTWPHIEVYRSHGLVIGINCDPDIPFVSTYVTLEGFE